MTLKVAALFTHLLMCFLLLGIVGEVDDSPEKGPDYYIWTHKKLDIGYNVNQIVDVNLTSEVKVKLEKGVKVPFTYQV